MQRDFYGLFPPGRHPCGGQSQLDMPERFLLERKMGGEATRAKREAEGKKVEELSLTRGETKTEKESERETL